MHQPLPLFPLPNVVLFPGMLLPLHVFEARYCQLVADILAGNGQFGLNLYETYNAETLRGIPYAIGTIAEILECQKLSDGRYYLLTRGVERYQLEELDTQHHPYWVGNIIPYQDTDTALLEEEPLERLKTLFREAIRLSTKIAQDELKTPLSLPEDQQDLSFFIAENLITSPEVLQGLLALQSTRERLMAEEKVLQHLATQLAVMSQIEEAFQSP